MQERIHFLDDEQMQISRSSLIFNVRSINEKFGKLEAFAREFDLIGHTNGNLFLVETRKPEYRFVHELVKKLLPYDLRKAANFIYAEEYPLYLRNRTLTPFLNQEHPQLEKISWLGSRITPDGNLVWLRDKSPAEVVEKEAQISSGNGEEVLDMDQIKFKAWEKGPAFPLAQDVLEEVALAGFVSAAEKGIPLFLGSQFGLTPSDFSWKVFEGQKVAVFQKSLLSGLEFGITVYHIKNGERVELKSIRLEGRFASRTLIHKKREPREEDEIHMNMSEILKLLEGLGIVYRGNSLSTLYDLVTRNAYAQYLSYSSRKINENWISFLSTEGAQPFLELYKLLDESRRVHNIRKEDQSPALRQQLAYFGKIRNPYHPRTTRYYELPGREVLNTLTEFGLCLHYNNHININSLEAWQLQQQILEEFRGRGFHIKNEYLLANHANPIEFKAEGGNHILRVAEMVTPREQKDVVEPESGLAVPDITYEWQYGLMNRLTDAQLIKRLNLGMGMNYWGGGRAAVVRALMNQLIKRSIDTSAISTGTSFSLKYCVILKNKKLIPVGYLLKNQLLSLVRGYLKKCYPGGEYGEIEIDEHHLAYLRIFSPVTNRGYIISTNDLIQRKGEMQTVTQWL